MPRRSSPDVRLVSIHPERMYLAKSVRAHLGIGDHAWRRLKTAGGLKPVVCSDREYITGSALIEAMTAADAKRREELR